MKLILAASPEVRGGRVRENVLKEIEELVGKSRDEIKVAIIFDASSSDEKSHYWQIEKLKSISDTFPKKTWLLNLFALSKAQLEWQINNADVIWCCGGSCDFLKLVFTKSGFDKMIPTILERKVWVGSSAGSMIMGRRGSTQVQEELNKGDMFYDVDDYLGIINACIYPHIYKDEIDENIYKIVEEESKIQSYPIYALSEIGAVIINGDKTYLVGTNCQKIQEGKVLEEV